MPGDNPVIHLLSWVDAIIATLLFTDSIPLRYGTEERLRHTGT